MNDSVLIVDDSLTVRMDLAEAFQAAGFTSLPCATLAQARRSLAGGAVGVVVLDVILPDGDGIDFLRELRARFSSSEVVVLMLSSEAEVKDRSRGLSTGADEYVGKPYDPNYVVARARELLRERRTAEATDRPTILLVEDSVTFRESLRGALEEAGYRVLTATTGEEGLRMAAGQRPAALLVDGTLPGIDGSTVIRRVRLDEALRGLPCVLMTGSEDRGAELNALEAGADAFVRKSDDVAVILARLAATLRRPASVPLDPAISMLGPRKVLVVDDSVTYLHEIDAALREEGYDVILAQSGEAALELLSVQAVDCVLLDLLMPGLSGEETCRRIKAAPLMRDIPLILLTALEDRSAMLTGLEAGADDYIQKSSEFEVLKARVRAQMRRKYFEDENRRIREELLRREFEASEARANRELAAARAVLLEELERKNRELEGFSYSVSHDLRAPLRAIDGFARLVLVEYAADLPTPAQDYLNRICQGTKRMGKLIDALLEFSRLGRQPLVTGSVDTALVVRQCLEDLQREQSDRHVSIVVGDLPTCDADPALLKQVFMNLLSNALKYTRPREEVCIEVGIRTHETEVEFCVRDNGIGFDMNYAQKLFGVFERLDPANEYEGTGVGLAIVQQIIDRHGGRVWAESEVDKGAAFYFTLPVATRLRAAA